MSKSTRIAMAVLISLAVIVGLYTTVFGASAGQSSVMAGSHLVSGAKVNLDHYREAAPAPALQPAYDGGKGHGCEHENRASPDD